MDKEKTKKQKRFVLVHGVCHGAWCWYKIIQHLEAAGHSVVAVDLAASGISPIKVEEIQSLKDYSKPLLEVLSSFGSNGVEKVILVAHSMGGIPAALAADIFPCKIAAIVFLTATMPDTKNPPSYPFEKDLELATLLVRENPALSIDNLSGTKPFTEEGYGSVTRVYIVCGKDNLIHEENQRLMISNFPPKEVMEITGADHMAMFSKPK